MNLESSSESPRVPPKRPSRVVIEKVEPEVDCGRFPIKRTVGEDVVVTADIHIDGHEALAGVLRHRLAGEARWREVPLKPLPNDRWRAAFRIERMASYEYTVEAWIDAFRTWRDGFRKKLEAGQDVAVERLIGASLVEAAGARASGEDAAALRRWAEGVRSASLDPLEEELAALMDRYPDRSSGAAHETVLPVTVDADRARCGAWYEMFPRSAAPAPTEAPAPASARAAAPGIAPGTEFGPPSASAAVPSPSRHGTFRDCEARLPYIAEMGFDVLYLPPIHPIGRTHRKGRNNSVECSPSDVGSPWAIGAEDGGHKSIHPELGTLEDFRSLIARARELGLQVAMDLAFQCSPDHPYVREHPGWFRQRPDGKIQHAENPPKKYEDIYPFEFENEDWQGLWEELKSVALYWAGQGIRIFRVDNPHTKPYAFWEWLIREVRGVHPETFFLAEAFTRPKVMYRLAKLGFSQSYTYFTWRNTARELRGYFEELTQTGIGEFFRPNLWPNTPDILPENLQVGGRPAFAIRLVLAATLGASYGIYGPAFELCEDAPIAPGKEEYLHSEKYELRAWPLEDPRSLRPMITAVNRARRENPALQSDRNLRFHEVTNEEMLVYSKHTDDRSNVVLMAVNLDPHHRQSGYVELPLPALGLDPQQPYQVEDLLSGQRYIWHGPRNYLELDPETMPAQILRVRRKLRTEHDFDYFL